MATLNDSRGNDGRGKYRVSTEAFGVRSTVDVYADSAVGAAFLAGLNSDDIRVNDHSDFTTDESRNIAHDNITVSAVRVGDAPKSSFDPDGDPLSVMFGLLFS